MRMPEGTSAGSRVIRSDEPRVASGWRVTRRAAATDTHCLARTVAERRSVRREDGRDQRPAAGKQHRGRSRRGAAPLRRREDGEEIGGSELHRCKRDQAIRQVAECEIGHIRGRGVGATAALMRRALALRLEAKPCHASAWPAAMPRSRFSWPRQPPRPDATCNLTLVCVASAGCSTAPSILQPLSFRPAKHRHVVTPWPSDDRLRIRPRHRRGRAASRGPVMCTGLLCGSSMSPSA